MTPLDQIQAFMSEQLRKLRALPKDAAVAALADQHIGGNQRLSPVEQLEIYREQFWLRHTGSLVEDYPGLGGILGESHWQRLVEEYLLARAPTSYTLRDLGLELPELVERASWLPHQGLCVDMARLERIYIEIFDAADAPPLDASRLAAIPESAWETARLVPHPALRLLKVGYPVVELRHALRSAEGHSAIAIPEPETQYLAVFRADLRLLSERLSAGAFALFDALMGRVPLVQACELAQREVPAEADAITASLAGWFQDWSARGWIVDVEIEYAPTP
ncbi:MAG TPA: DNA-binding domain-containing protein [Polyangiaceae bacterium]|jgi:hypothetical protein